MICITWSVETISSRVVELDLKPLPRPTTSTAAGPIRKKNPQQFNSIIRLLWTRPRKKKKQLRLFCSWKAFTTLGCVLKGCSCTTQESLCYRTYSCDCVLQTDSQSRRQRCEANAELTVNAGAGTRPRGSWWPCWGPWSSWLSLCWPDSVSACMWVCMCMCVGVCKSVEGEEKIRCKQVPVL